MAARTYIPTLERHVERLYRYIQRYDYELSENLEGEPQGAYASIKQPLETLRDALKTVDN